MPHGHCFQCNSTRTATTTATQHVPSPQKEPCALCCQIVPSSALATANPLSIAMDFPVLDTSGTWHRGCVALASRLSHAAWRFGGYPMLWGAGAESSSLARCTTSCYARVAGRGGPAGLAHMHRWGWERHVWAGRGLLSPLGRCGQCYVNMGCTALPLLLGRT